MASALRHRVAIGAAAGAIAWAAMDGSLRYMYDRHPGRVRRQERDARRGVPALEVLADRICAAAGARLTADGRRTAGRVVQWTVGIGAGVLFAVIRERMPASGIRRGLSYGLMVSLVVDEGLTPPSGLSPGPAAYPWQTHARGLVGHLVYGAVAEAVIAAFDPERAHATANQRI